MNPENIITPEAEFVMRRTQEALPAWALFLPVAFAFLVFTWIGVEAPIAIQTIDKWMARRHSVLMQ